MIASPFTSNYFVIRKSSRLLILLASILFSLISYGQTNIGYIYPAGGQQGTSFDVVVGGQNLDNIKGVYFSGKGCTGEITGKIPVDLKAKNLRIKEQDIPQLEEQIKVRITLSAKAEPGIRDFRLVTEEGFSNRIFFEVGQLPESREVAQNNSIEEANLIQKTPVVINGQIMPGKGDFFRFAAKEGETLVCQSKARILLPYLADAVPGWFQPVLTLRNSKGKEVAYNDDFGQQPDPVIIYKVPESDDYTLEIKDAIYRGREDFVYRITIGDVPFVTSVFPLGSPRGKRVKVNLTGVNLNDQGMKVQVKRNSPDRIFLNARGKNGILSNSFAFAASDKKEIFQKESSRSVPYNLPPNEVVNATISYPGKEDWYLIKGEPGENRAIEVSAHQLGSWLDADLTVFDERGKILAQNDDFKNESEGLETFHADPKLLYTFGKSGFVLLRVRDVQGHGGKEYGYRLWTGKPQPDFELSIEPSNLTIHKGGTTSFTVHALRKYNFKGEINLQLKGLPAGFTYSSSRFRKGQNELRMTLSAPLDADMGKLDLAVTGFGEANGVRLEHKAKPVEQKMQAFIYLHLLPADDFLGSVVKPLPFSVSHSIQADSVIRVGKNGFGLKVSLNRITDFKLPVQIALDKAPKGFRMKPVVIPPEEKEATVIIENPFPRFNQNVNLVISGTARLPKKRKEKAKVYKALSQAIMVESGEGRSLAFK